MLLLPAHCTGELQTLEFTVNSVLKQELKACFIKWYAGLVKDQLGDGIEINDIKADLRISLLIPLHVHWLTEAISNISSALVVEGLIKSGIKDSTVKCCCTCISLNMSINIVFICYLTKSLKLRNV